MSGDVIGLRSQEGYGCSILAGLLANVVVPDRVVVVYSEMRVSVPILR